MKLSCAVIAALLALPTSIHASEPARHVHFSGKIFSSTGSLPPKLEMFGRCGDERERIVGKAEGDTYHIILPVGVKCRVKVAAYEWDSRPMFEIDAATAIALPILIYPDNVPEAALASELIAMGEQDQAWRGSNWNPNMDADTVKRLTAEQRAREQRLGEIIVAKGWPTFSMVGWQAANAAWLVAQHAPPPLLKRWLVLMQQAAARHEIDTVNLATTIDRDLMYDNKKQLYGTQPWTGPDGKPGIYPIADIAQLGQRRSRMGLMPFADQLKLMKISADSAQSWLSHPPPPRGH